MVDRRSGEIESEECQAIARELGESLAEAWFFTDQQGKDAWLAVYKMIGGTEEDVQRAEELAPKANFGNLDWLSSYAQQGGPELRIGQLRGQRIKHAIMRRFAHEARTGHRVPRRLAG